jgi:NADPH:quinone reductase-like Zn-dependent oxidoreductase
MRAILQRTLGGPEVLETADVPRPSPISTEVLVRVRAAGVNPTDWKSRQANPRNYPLPFTLGWDVSGVVEELGDRTTLYRVGDEVLGMPWFPRLAGGYSEYVAAPARQFVRKPAALTHEQAAGLPLAGLTAWQALVDLAELRPGQRVLVTAAAGGVGHLAVQIAKALGAHVVGTASAAKHDFLYELGIDEVIDYTSTELADVVRDVDIALDLAGGPNGALVLPTMREGGLLICPVGVPEGLADAGRDRGVRVSPVLVEPDHAGLVALVGLVEAGMLRVHVQETFPLADAARAHEVGEGGHVTGKLVLTV